MAAKLAGIYGVTFGVFDDDELLVSQKTEAGSPYQNIPIIFE